MSCHHAVARRLRGHIEHVLNSVYLLLERRCYGVSYDLRVCAGKARANDYGRRSDLRVLAYGQCKIRYQTYDYYQDRDHCSEYRPVYEKPGHYLLPSNIAIGLLCKIALLFQRQDPGMRKFISSTTMSSSTGSTLIPGWTLCRPLTITRSSGITPSLTILSPFILGPSVT